MNVERREKIASTALLVGRIAIGLLFTLSGYSKLVQPVEYFEFIIDQYAIVPDALIHGVALVVPWIEFLFGFHLMIGLFTPFYAWGLAGLTFAFQIVLGQAVLRKLPMDECGCFGAGFVHLSLYQSFLIDTVILLILLRIAERSKLL
jgi:uncharacterized membrane protein YphA (DoxX/SURF4 family)